MGEDILQCHHPKDRITEDMHQDLQLKVRMRVDIIKGY